VRCACEVQPTHDSPRSADDTDCREQIDDDLAELAGRVLSPTLRSALAGQRQCEKCLIVGGGR
jgi:hypothetical protein